LLTHRASLRRLLSPISPAPVYRKAVWTFHDMFARNLHFGMFHIRKTAEKKHAIVNPKHALFYIAD
jgi:hypothetical protein